MCVIIARDVCCLTAISSVGNMPMLFGTRRDDDDMEMEADNRCV
jgi:hypothetical protein